MARRKPRVNKDTKRFNKLKLKPGSKSRGPSPTLASTAVCAISETTGCSLLGQCLLENNLVGLKELLAVPGVSLDASCVAPCPLCPEDSVSCHSPIELLLAHGSAESVPCLKVLSDKFSPKDLDQRCDLHLLFRRNASVDTRESFLKLLFDQGCSPDKVCPETGKSLLEAACFTASEPRDAMRLVRLILNHGGDPTHFRHKEGFKFYHEPLVELLQLAGARGLNDSREAAALAAYPPSTYAVLDFDFIGSPMCLMRYHLGMVLEFESLDHFHQALELLVSLESDQQRGLCPKLLCAAVKMGSLGLLKQALEVTSCALEGEIVAVLVKEAAQRGYMHLIEFVFHKAYVATEDVDEARALATKQGYQNTAQVLSEYFSS